MRHTAPDRPAPDPVPARPLATSRIRARLRTRLRALAELKFDLAIIALILAMLWGAIGVWLDDERARIEHGAEQAAANIAGVAEQGVSRTIEAIDHQLRVARDTYARDPAGFSTDLIPGGRYNDGMVVQLAVIDAAGRHVFTNLGPADGTLSLADRPHFRAHLERSEDFLFISVPVLGRVSGRWTVQFTRKVFGADGSLAGVVVCSLDPYWFTQFQELLDFSGTMLLLGKDGVVRAAAPDGALLGQNISDTPLGRAAVGAVSGSLRMPATEGVAEQIFSFRQLRNYPIAVAIGMETAPLAGSYQRILLGALSVGGGLTVLVLAAGALLIRNKRRLLLSRQVLRHAIENLDQGLVMVDRDGGIVLRNSRYLALLDLPPEMAEPGAEHARIIHWQARQGEFGEGGSDLDFARWLASSGLKEGRGVCLRERVRPDGRVLEARHRFLADGGMVSTFTDITERRRAEAEVRHLAHHDTLTDLANRLLLEQRLTKALEAAGRSGGSVTVLCIDLDRFKSVNDALGHAAGDELLRQVAGRLRGLAQPADIVSRVDGDEFVLVRPGLSEPGDAAALAESILSAIRLPCDYEGVAVSLEACAGIAISPGDGATVAALLANVETALHRAEDAGRGATSFFEPSMEARLRERDRMERDLRAALSGSGLSVHFQPLHACATGEVTAFEALVRWNHPERGPIPPAEFIPVAEESGLILLLGERVLREACAAAAGWERPCTVAVNLSPLQFRRGDLPLIVAEALATTGLSPSRLELEVTESLLIEDAEGVLKAMRSLKSLGVRLALDDFGTGYSSLSYLRRFPFDKLKIDKSFVQSIGADPGGRAIVEAIIAMARSLQLRTTAEGVETQEQLDYLRRQGCDEVQGFLLGRAMAGSAIPDFLGHPAPA